MSDVSDEFTLTTSQVNEIEALLSAKRYAAAYRRVAELANGRDELNASIAWLKGAADVNENIGSQSAFIRAYTTAHYQKGTEKLLILISSKMLPTRSTQRYWVTSSLAVMFQV